MIKKFDDSNLLAALSYCSVLSVVMLLIKKDDEFIYWHARQGTVLFIASALGFVPVLGWFIVLVTFVLAVIGFVKALQGKKYSLPFVSRLAEMIPTT